MFRSHTPAGRVQPRSAVAAAATPRPHRKVSGEAKRCRSPCEDELRYKELLVQKQRMQQRVRQQVDELAGLDENILDFYYTHTIRYEPLLQADSADTTPPIDAQPAVNFPISSGLVSLFPELKDTSKLAAGGGDGTAALESPDVPSKTRYYYDSALMRLYREAALQERDLAQQHLAEEARVSAAEQQIQRDVIDGALASQLRSEHEHRATLQRLESVLAELRATCAGREADVRAVEGQMEATEKAIEACGRRKAILEANKQEQMNNAEKIKDEVAQFRRSVEAATRELEQRRLVNASLEEEIARRRGLLRRRRKE